MTNSEGVGSAGAVDPTGSDQHAEFVCPEPECFDSACELFCKLRPAESVAEKRLRHAIRCDCDGIAEYALTMLGSTSNDRTSLYCWACVMVVLDDWDEKAEAWADTPGWTVERLTGAHIDG